ncbi:MAG: FAD-binding protein [Christensenellales bacterium]|jgi:urocanate reductase
MSKKITRRDFLKSSAMGAAGVAILGLTGKVEASESIEPIAAIKANSLNWAESADMIVVGGGGAGFCAAIEAGRNGATVLILEKAGFVGGDTIMSNGMLMAAGTKVQEELRGITDDTPEIFAEQQIAYAQGYANEDMIREMCLKSPEAVQFMLDLGRVYEQCDIIPPIWSLDTENSWNYRSHWTASQTAGANSDIGHFGMLKKQVDKMDNVKYYLETEVAHLVCSSAGEVIGVQTSDGIYYRADKGVVIASSSFGANKDMARRYNPMQYWGLTINEKYKSYFYNQIGTNTGDGIRMAQEIGADLALSPANVMLDNLYIGGVGSGRGNHINEYNSTSIRGVILVNDKGLRFVQEDAHWGFVTQEVFKEALKINWTAETDIKVWAILDADSLQDNIIANARMQADNPYGSLVQSADTLQELAEKIGISSIGLENTVARWNSFSETEIDHDFDRRTDFAKIETGPFYAMPFIPNLMGSHGGLRTDIDTRVLKPNGKPIPRLYAAGTSMSGNWVGQFYSACGWAILGTVHWGRKAGKNIAALDPWTTTPIASSISAISTPQDNLVVAGNYTPGVYSAVGKGLNGDVPVSVEFSETSIVSINIGQNSETQGVGTAAIENFPARIIKAQSVDIDTISGATVTCNAIKQAVTDCIVQASK